MDTIKSKTVNLTGEITQESYKGEFKFKCLLSPMDRIDIDKQYRAILGENIHQAGLEAIDLANILSELSFRVAEAPSFWHDSKYLIPGSHIPDKNVLLAIYEFSLQAELDYREELKKKSEEAKKDIKKELDKQDKQDENQGQ